MSRTTIENQWASMLKLTVVLRHSEKSDSRLNHHNVFAVTSFNDLTSSVWGRWFE